MTFEYEARGAKELQAKVKRLKGDVKRGVMEKGMVSACLRVIRHAQARRFRRGAYDQPAVPGILTTRSGSAGLMGSIHHAIEWAGENILGRVGSPLVYARIHELGGRAGRNRAARIRPRPYLKPSVKAQERNINKDFQTALWSAIKRANLA